MRNRLIVAGYVALATMVSCGSGPTALPTALPKAEILPALELVSAGDAASVPFSLFMYGDGVVEESRGWKFQDWRLAIVPKKKVEGAKEISIWFAGHVETAEGIDYPLAFDDRIVWGNVKSVFDAGYSELGLGSLVFCRQCESRISDIATVPSTSQMAVRFAAAANPTKYVIATRDYGTFVAPFETRPRKSPDPKKLFPNPEPFAGFLTTLEMESTPGIAVEPLAVCLLDATLPHGAIWFTINNTDKLRSGTLKFPSTDKSIIYAVYFDRGSLLGSKAVTYKDGQSGTFHLDPGSSGGTGSLVIDSLFNYPKQLNIDDTDPLYLVVVGPAQVRLFEAPPRCGDARFEFRSRMVRRSQ